jgi:site-specific DNA-methyltransferase (adenine-specific)
VNWTLTHGSCLDPESGLASLEDASVDHVIADPPYEAAAHTKGRRIKRPGWRKSGDDHGTDACVMAPLPFAPIDDAHRTYVAAHYARVVRRWIIVFCQMEATHLWRAALEAGGARYVRIGIWLKPDGQPQLTGDRPGLGYENFVIAHSSGTGRMRWNGGGRHAVWTAVRSQEGLHPTAKPLPLMEALIRDFTDRGDVILDSHAGSGTTGVAAIRLGRRFLGYEIDPGYHALAVRRLSDTREQRNLFDDVKPRAKQLSIGGEK